MNPAPALRTLSSHAPSGPPAVLAAYLRHARWKNWALAGQFLVILFLVTCVFAAVRRDPDVVLVAPDGASSYLNRSLAGDALLRFLAEQRQLPSETTIVHFSKTFLDAALAVNSSTIEAVWPQMLALMEPGLAETVSKQATSQKLLEGYRLSQTKTSLAYEELTLLEHNDSLVHLHAILTRSRSTLLGNATTALKWDRVGVDLVERIVPRSPAHPDGLVVSDERIEVLPDNPHVANAAIGAEAPHAH